MKIIFDCFGTLIDTGTGSVGAAAEILRNVGSDLDPAAFYREWKALKREMTEKACFDAFQSEKKLFEISLGETFWKNGIRADAAKEAAPMIRTLFSVRKVYPETREILAMLDRKGTEWAIGSTTDTDSLLHFMKWNGLKAARIFTSEDLRVYKPDPRFYRAILEKTGWDAGECLWVGDSLTDDVKGPQAVGMKTALIDRKNSYSAACGVKPDHVIASLLDLEALIV
ncbi:MAG: HAD family hydrolase [Clostridia bacterium]|nr:HAD family hydrolase [Clostridia bacterium]